jgi:Kdo2-lipid IVA lauroyltransferase/acyltransferase
VALLVDQNVDWYDGVFVPFFGDIACTNKALAVLALRTGAPVIPIYNFRRPDGGYQVVFQPEVELIRTGGTTSDIEENTALFNRIIERYVRRHPEQWFWMHQRWKTRPWQPWPRRRE